MEKVKERAMVGVGAIIFYLFLIGALWLVSSRMEYVKEYQKGENVVEVNIYSQSI